MRLSYNYPVVAVFYCFIIGLAKSYAFRSYNLVTSAISTQMSSWDETNGVWIGNKVANDMEIPKPLFVLGYGSLIWKPGVILEDLSSYSCQCIGWRRFFSQRSCDHRGTVDFPGLVMTLLHENYLKSIGLVDSHSSSHCLGKVWRIPDELTVDLVDELDYRERGGYEREIIQVRLLEDTETHQAGSIVSALVYTAKPHNPNFYIPTTRCSKLLKLRICDIISVAKGPSGRNIDYFVNLATYLNRNGLSDSYLNEIIETLYNRIGPHHSFWFENDHPTHSSNSHKMSLNVYGWGSNEFGQLSYLRSSQKTFDDDVRVRPTLIHTFHDISKPNAIWLCSGGSISGFLTKQKILTFWGHQFKLHPSLPDGMISLTGITSVAFNQDYVALLLDSGYVIEFGGYKRPSSLPFLLDSSDVTVVRHHDDSHTHTTYSFVETLSKPEGESDMKLVKLISGLRHTAGLTAHGQVIMWGDNSHQQCGDVTRFPRIGSVPFWQPNVSTKVIDIACGCRHTVAIDEDGKLWSWGDDRFGSLGRPVASQDDSHEHPGNRRKLTYRLDGTPTIVDTSHIHADIRWSRICSGWSHIVARGVRPDGSCVVVGWGRSDFAQFGHLSGTAAADTRPNTPVDHLPKEIRLPEAELEITEVWCGSEFTVVMDSNNRLWFSGWNEHGNAGNGMKVSTPTITRTWTKITMDNDEQVELISPWTESVACGGAHVLCSNVVI